ncbi:putative glycerol-3-phosphate o-acyltransferase [Erysiphe necator]|uniref:Putative glycerol-3-phosphate o-acyltransferase n=1 Tax=Uncinula necator TaxID=52586 RepID=A0A0B1P4M8_UNCNE|nr:putative glycerol-3-phosphate o-acyltransferase [Erysiphe necator]
MADSYGTREQMPAFKLRHLERHPMTNWIYDFFLWVFSIMIDLFFREVHPRGSWKVPRKGPIILVAAPHANQFVDPLILMKTLRTDCRRRASFLIAAKSMDKWLIGWFARKVGAMPVARALDMVRAADGTIYMPEPDDDPLLIRGFGTKFGTNQAKVGDLLVLPTVHGIAANAEIGEIISFEELRLKKPFRDRAAITQLTQKIDCEDSGVEKLADSSGTVFKGSSYKIAPKVDQTKVYDAVFDRLRSGGAVGIFPEGGSHDRTELLPLKAGVAIMALGALAADPDSNLKIIPCGLNYFHAHKFRSRAVVEFGNPIDIPKELVELYRNGERREAVGKLLETVYQSLVAVTVTSPDYDTLMLIQAARRLYNPTGRHLPLPMVVELNRRLVKGYKHYKNDPRVVSLQKAVLNYNKQLRYLNIKDHQVEYAKHSIPKIITLLLYRLGKISILSIGVLPGLVLFSPVFVASKVISIKKSREALASSTVKLQGRDVVATWKLLVALIFTPILYNVYTFMLTYWTYRNRIQGYVPQWVPLTAVVLFGYIIFTAITFAALRFGEVGMDIFKSLRPLLLSLHPASSNSIRKLKERREKLSAQVTNVINTLGPEVFPDFDASRIVADPFVFEGSSPTIPTRMESNRRGSDHSSISEMEWPGIYKISTDYVMNRMNGNLPRSESLSNLGNISLFATRPPSRSRSRSSSRGEAISCEAYPLQSLSTLNSASGLEVVSSKIRDAMRERGLLRRKTIEGLRSEDVRDEYYQFCEKETGIENDERIDI